jgi:hypothetical protein
MIDKSGSAGVISTGVLGCALVGVVLSLVLQGYFTANWDRYVESIPAARMTQRAGVVPRPHIAATKLSARDGAVTLLIAALVVALVARRPWIGLAAFGLSAAAANVALAVVSAQIRGNLWPLGTLAVLLLTFAPVMVGGAAGGGLRMVRKRGSVGMAALALLLAGVIRCASAPQVSSSGPVSQATAELSLVHLAPEPGTVLSRTSRIEAAFNYRLSNRKSGATYTLAPAFTDRRGAGYKFNAVAGPADVITLTTPEGRVEMRYSIVREWANPRLAKPIELWFQIVEMEASRGRIVAEIGPYRYPAAEQ